VSGAVLSLSGILSLDWNLCPPRCAPGMTNFNLQKCDKTDLKECLPNIAQSI